MSQQDTNDRIEFYASGTLPTWLEQRAGDEKTLSSIAQRDLERYYDMLMRSLPTFNEEEALLICDALKGAIIQQYNAPLLWSEVSIALRQCYAKQWAINGPCLLERCRTLTPFECMAIEDAVERYRNGAYYQDGRTPRERLYAVGLVQRPVPALMK